MSSNNDQIVAMLAGTSFAAGLNVYATVATLGLLSRGGVIALPSSLDVVQNWWIIAVALVMFAMEFVADKIPAFDLIWNALHTFIRIPVAAYLAYAAAAPLSPGMQLASGLLGGAIAFVAHSGKTALRAAVTPSPEPVSNIALSFGEDASAIGLSWVAVQHPYIAAGLVIVLLLVTFLLLRWVLASLTRFLYRARDAISRI